MLKTLFLTTFFFSSILFGQDDITLSEKDIYWKKSGPAIEGVYTELGVEVWEYHESIVTESGLNSLTTELKKSIPSTYPTSEIFNKPVAVYIFSNQTERSIPTFSSIDGFAILERDANGYLLNYFKKNGDIFKKDVILSSWFRRTISSDIVSLLHIHSTFDGVDNPRIYSSTHVYKLGFIGGYDLENIDYEAEYNFYSKIALSEEHHYLYSYSFFANGNNPSLIRLEARGGSVLTDPPYVNCKKWEACRDYPSNNNSCNSITGACHSGATCSGSKVSAIATEIGLNSDENMLEGLYDIRAYLLKSKKGRKYVSTYYKYNHLVKIWNNDEPIKSTERVLKYFNLCSKITRSFFDLEKDPENFYLEESLVGEILEIVDEHRDVPNEDFQKALDQLETDLVSLTGKDLGSIVDYLER